MKRKRRLEIFAFYDSEGIAAHLNHMAQKGWALQSIGTTFWTYEAIEPENRTYGITFFPDVSAFDTKPTEALQDFIAYCEEAGWHYVAQLSQMQIFYTTNENPIPLETDESLRLEITHKAMKKNFLPGILAQLALCLWEIYLTAGPIFRDLSRYIADTSQFLLVALYTFLGLYALLTFLFYFRWRKKSLAAVEAGGTCLPTGKGMQLSAKAMHAVTLLFFVALFYSMRQQGYGTVFLVVILAYACIFGLIFMSINILRKKQVSRNVNKGVIIALCVLLPLIFMVGSFHYIFNREEPMEGKETYTTTLSDGTTYTTVLEADPLPLTTADLTEVPADAIYSMSCEEESSFLAKRMECSQYTPGGSPEAPELSYEILEVSYDFLIEPCIRSYQKPFLPQFAHSESWEPISISGTDSAWQSTAAMVLAPIIWHKKAIVWCISTSTGRYRKTSWKKPWKSSLSKPYDNKQIAEILSEDSGYFYFLHFYHNSFSKAIFSLLSKQTVPQ